MLNKAELSAKHHKQVSNQIYQQALSEAKISEEKIRLSLIIYPDLDDEDCKKFWNNKTKISLKQFDKSSVIYGRHPTKRLKNGICIIRVNSSPGLKEKIIIWKDYIIKELCAGVAQW